MNGDKKYWLHEAYRHLYLALIGARKNSRKHIDAALEALTKFEKELEKE